MNASRRAQRGISMIEAATTLTVLAVLLGAVAPSVGTWMRNLRIRNAAESVQNGLQRARMEALRRNQTVMFSLVTASGPAALDNTCALSSNSASWVISLDSPALQCAAALSSTGTPALIEKAAAGVGSAGVTVAALQADNSTVANSVTFNGFGRVVGTTGVARIDFDNAVTSNDYRPLRVLLTPAGAVRMCDPRITNTADPRYC
ncbi:MAG TPA: GspH/FimT family pseudopilin [Burkholderiaceae bacterium]|nr:GspH/FimT family pseudopilin [Burkholderiaceae bacterium]